MFSVIIPLYNKEKYISNTINSVLNQSFPDFELIIVNDGSTDNSLAEIEKFTDNRIKLVSQTNSGESSARNHGISNAKYEYIAFLDADDLWSVDYLKSINEIINKFPECGVFSTNYGFKRNNSIIPAFKSKYFNESKIIDNYFVRSIDKPLITSNTAVVKKNIFSEVGFFDIDLKIGPDLEMWFRIMLKYKLAFHPYIGAIYNLDAQGRVMNEKREPNIVFISKLINNIKYITPDKHLLSYISVIAFRELIIISKNHNKKTFKKVLFRFIELKSISSNYTFVAIFPFKNLVLRIINKINIYRAISKNN